VKGTIPSRLKPQARWKWEAWAKLKGVPAAKAMKKYLAYLKKMQPQWEKEAAKLAKSPPRQSKL
jgi:acyl-CoA-binding protein